LPTIGNIPGPYRFYFYSFDCQEPIHVHVERDQDSCKFWLKPLALAANRGFPPHELGRIRQIIKINSERMTDAWRQQCNPF
jgi:hypothetical protein